MLIGIKRLIEVLRIPCDLSKYREKYDSLAGILLELQQLMSDYEAKQVMDAFRKSGKSLQELMTFLDV